MFENATIMYSVFMITVYIHVCCFRGTQGRLKMPTGHPSLNKDVTYLLKTSCLSNGVGRLLVCG